MDEDEQDNLRGSQDHKKKKRKSKKSSSTSSAEREVADLERDVQSKRSSASGRDIASGPVAVTDGEVTTEPPTRAGSVQPMDAAEALPGASGDASDAVVPGAVTAISSEPDARAGINSLEADVMAKNRARPTARAGAFAATTGSQSGKTSGRSIQSSTSATSEARNQLTGIQSLEQDIAAKNRARPGATGTMVDPASRKVSREANRDVSGGKVAAVAAATGAAVAANNAARSEPSVAAPPSSQKPPWSEPSVVPPPSGSKQFEEFEDENKHPQDDGTGDDGFGEANVYHQPSPPEDSEHQSSQELLYALPEGYEEDGENAGIEAFVADLQVVDATGVALVMSDVEVDIQEKKRFRRILLFGIGGLILLTAAIVTPIAVLFGKNEASGPTVAPTPAPTGTPTLAPSSSRFADILEFARTISSPESLEDPNSPQYLAADWVAYTDEVQAAMGSVKLTQRYILAVFYFSTGGDNWEECNRLLRSCNIGFRWLTGEKSECLWHGIRCTEDQHVSNILIGNQAPLGNNLEGTLPTELSELSGMVSIVLIEGKVGGTLPVEYGRLTNLTTIFIQDMELTGTIPEELLKNTPKMDMLAFGNNRLTGTIPSSLASLPLLRDLQLTGNFFTGTIPAQLGNLELKMSKFCTHNRILFLAAISNLTSIFDSRKPRAQRQPAKWNNPREYLQPTPAQAIEFE